MDDRDEGLDVTKMAPNDEEVPTEPVETVETPEVGASEGASEEAVEASRAVEPKAMDEPMAEPERKTLPRLPKPPKRSHRQRNIFFAIVGILAAVLVLCGGVALGANIQKQEEGTVGVGGIVEVTPETLLGGGGGIPLVDVKQVVEDDKLALAFLKLHNTESNSCYSPLSVRYALEMLSEGASGETKAQIDALLGSAQATRYANVSGHLNLANSLWMQTEWEEKVLDSYKEILQQKYGAEVFADEFKTATALNDWVERNTLGLIKNAFSDDDVQAMQAAVVNALALDMNWEKQFMKEFTFGGYFDFEEGDVEAENLYTTMKRYGGQDVYYNLAADATVLALDLKEYDGLKLQFVAMMPENLTEFVKTVSNSDVNRLLSGLRRAMPQNDTYNFSFTAYIPKFSIKGGVKDLIGDLRELGVTDAFDENAADFSKMVDTENFFINGATQKTTFDFSEEGIKAAAVTLLGGMGAAGGPGPIPSSVDIVVSINKPFMYLVRDVKTGEIWFTGTVYEPNSWADEKANYIW